MLVEGIKWDRLFAGVRSKYGYDRGEEAAIGIVLALATVFVTGLVCPSDQAAPGGGRRAAERILTYTGAVGGREISAWFMKATGRTEWWVYDKMLDMNS